MAKIIRQDYPVTDFNKLVREFLYSDARVTLPKGSLIAVEERLIKVGPLFSKMFKPYFELEGNVRFDKLMSKMAYFGETKIPKIRSSLKNNEKKVFNLFWDDVSAIIAADYPQYGEQYLKNCCGAFIHMMKRLQKE
jgi:hypothetical protein